MYLKVGMEMHQVIRLATTICLLTISVWGCARPPDPFGRQVNRAMEASLQGQEFLSEGKGRRAERAFAKSLEINRSIDNPLGSAQQLNNLAAVALTRGKTDEARKLLQQALFINQGVGDAAEAAINLANLATIAQKGGNLPKAEGYLQEARDMARLSGSAKVKGQVLCQMAGLALDQHDPGTAAVLLAEARPVGQEAEVQGAWNYQQGRLMLFRGDSVKALDSFQKALAADRSILNKTGMGADLQGLGKVWEDQGDFLQAFLYYSRAFELYASTNSQEKAQLCLDALRRVNKSGGLGRSLKPFEQQLAASRAADAPCPPPSNTSEPAKDQTASQGIKTPKPQKGETCLPGSELATPDNKQD
jgi:tetratricopeptide (TPR) repeat protein